MDRVNLIWHHPVYQKLYVALQWREKDRLFCRHDMEHFLSVARLMWMYALESRWNQKKDVLYGTALLHDLGRIRQYEFGEPHDVAGARIARDILATLPQTDRYTADEERMMVEAIACHRRKGEEAGSRLSELLALCDKEARLCFVCPVQNQCKWPEEKRNEKIRY